jgi:hypothetical protein
MFLCSEVTKRTVIEIYCVNFFPGCIYIKIKKHKYRVIHERLPMKISKYATQNTRNP